MIPNAVLGKLFAIAFAHVFPQCAVTMQVGDAWQSTESAARNAVMRSIHHYEDRDVRLEEKIIGFRSRRYPGAQVIGVTCTKAIAP